MKLNLPEVWGRWNRNLIEIWRVRGISKHRVLNEMMSVTRLLFLFFSFFQSKLEIEWWNAGSLRAEKLVFFVVVVIIREVYSLQPGMKLPLRGYLGIFTGIFCYHKLGKERQFYGYLLNRYQWAVVCLIMDTTASLTENHLTENIMQRLWNPALDISVLWLDETKPVYSVWFIHRACSLLLERVTKSQHSSFLLLSSNGNTVS